MNLNNAACKADVDAEWRQKLINNVGCSKHYVKFSKTKVYIYLLCVWQSGGSFYAKIQHATSFGSSWARVVQITEKDANLEVQRPILEHRGEGLDVTLKSIGSVFYNIL